MKKNIKTKEEYPPYLDADRFSRKVSKNWLDQLNEKQSKTTINGQNYYFNFEKLS